MILWFWNSFPWGIIKINSQAYALGLLPCSLPKAKKFLNGWVQVVVLLPEGYGLEMQEHFPDSETWLGGSCVPLATSLSACWIHCSFGFAEAAIPGTVCKLEQGNNSKSLLVFLEVVWGRKSGLRYLPLLWKPDVLTNCDEGINGSWEQGAFLYWVWFKRAFC